MMSAIPREVGKKGAGGWEGGVGEEGGVAKGVIGVDEGAGVRGDE